MKNFRFLLLLLIVVVSFYGCASFTSPARQHILEEGRTYWFDYDASRRGAILIPKYEEKNIAICAEPSPDIALEILNKFKADVGTDKIAIGTEADIQEKVIQLAKRTQTVMFLREALYRLCELSLNSQLDKKDVIELYKQVIEAASEIAEAELKNAEQGLEEAKKKSMEAERKLIETMEKTPGLIDAYKERLKKENR